MLTGDGALQARIAHPRHKLPKVYYVQVEGTPARAQLETLARGVDLGEFVTKPAKVSGHRRAGRPVAAPSAGAFSQVGPHRWLSVELTEGRNRQVRRMTAAVGLPTLRLIRWSVGPWTLDGLTPGQWRRAQIESAPQADRSR